MMPQRAKVGSAAAALAAAALAAAVAARAQGPAVKATPQEWTLALTAVKQVAMSPQRPVLHRANAVMAYAKLQSFRAQHADAQQTCWEVLKAARTPELAEAAARAAGFVSRQVHGHLGGCLALIDDWARKAPGGPGREALAKVRMDLIKARQYLAGQAAKKMPPMPLRVGMAGWAAIRPKSGVSVVTFPTPQVVTPVWMAITPGRGPSALTVSVPDIPPSPLLGRDKSTGIPSALAVTFPVYSAPDWYQRVTFPLLTEPKK